MLDNKWIKKPSKQIPIATSHEIRSKARNYSSKINKALHSNELSIAKETMDDIRRLRQAGLETNGENAVENLAFKLLRSRGRIDKLRNHIDKLQSAELSLGEQMKINEIIKESSSTAVVTNYKPGELVAITMPNGTQIQKDLSKDPGAITKDEQGNPVFNMSSLGSSGSAGSMQTSDKPITNGTQIAINTDGQGSGETMGHDTPGITAFETQEEDLEDEDLMGSGVDHLKNPHDRTDDYINDIVDKRFERGARGSMSSKTSGSFGPVSGKLQESDELYKWLTIAGIK